MDIHFNTIPATFHHIPRTGGTSFTQWVEDNIKEYTVLPQLDWTPQNTNSIHNFNLIKSFWPNMGFRFAFVRNPYSRLVSLYHYVGQQAQKRVDTFKKCLHDKTTPTNWKSYAYQSDNMMTAMLDDIKLLELYNRGFDYYIDCLCNNSNEWYAYTNNRSHHLIKSYWHNESQVKWFCGNMPNLIIKIENAGIDFIHIQDMFNCYTPLPNINTTIHQDYKSYYSDKTKELVSKHFNDDLTAFGYSF
jgi:hypothetical protein